MDVLLGSSPPVAGLGRKIFLILSAPSYKFLNIVSMGRRRGEKGMSPPLHQDQRVGVMAQLGACVRDGAQEKGSVHQVN